jgi:hypothetical protein
MKPVLVGLALFLILFVGVTAFGQSTPSRVTSIWENAKQLHPGIRLLQMECTEPRPMKVHCVWIELEMPRIAFHSTPRAKIWVENKMETVRQTTREYLIESRKSEHPLVFAANADWFSPWPAPYQLNTPSNVGGLAISEGKLVSPASGTPSLIVTKSGSASIQLTTAETSLEDVQMAVSGFALCLIDSVVQPSGTDLHPRTGVGLSEDRKHLYLVAIDGRRFSSQGATTSELGDWLKKLGADDGINMDGGGSTTFAWWNTNGTETEKCELINSPVGNGAKYETAEKEKTFAPTERANGNNFGVYYRTESPN